MDALRHRRLRTRMKCRLVPDHRVLGGWVAGRNLLQKSCTRAALRRYVTGLKHLFSDWLPPVT